MSVFLQIGDIHGRSCFGSFSIKHCHRKIDYHLGSVNVVWPCVLGDVGAGMEQSNNTGDFRDIYAPCYKDK
jgi:hypothetical protein